MTTWDLWSRVAAAIVANETKVTVKADELAGVVHLLKLTWNRGQCGNNHLVRMEFEGFEVVIDRGVA